ncbi:MAG: hypothetical protein J5977_08020 [Fibrobacter sp.]|nr:hypothetical protein [Fibrobacter sp. UWH4]MBO5532388.1 hypothetical protein [Fibrobacter sp.]SHK23231.1 hypothetical protein SAMN05720762_101142 [Fibrobacter sp. UWH4]
MSVEYKVKELEAEIKKLKERVDKLEQQNQPQVPPPKEDPPNMMHY